MRIFNPMESVYLRLGAKVYGGQDRVNYLANPCSFRKKALLVWDACILRDLLADIQFELPEIDRGESAPLTTLHSRPIPALFEEGIGSFMAIAAISLGVLKSVPYNTLIEFASKLFDEIAGDLSEEARESFGRSLYTVSRLQVMEVLEAEDCVNVISTPGGEYEQACVQFRDSDTGWLVSNYVWNEYPVLRAPLIKTALSFLPRNGLTDKIIRNLRSWALEDAQYAMEKIVHPLVESASSPEAYAAARIILEAMAGNPATSENVLREANSWWKQEQDNQSFSRMYFLATSIFASHGNLQSTMWTDIFLVLRNHAVDFFNFKSFRNGSQLSFVLHIICLMEKHEPLLNQMVSTLTSMAREGGDLRQEALQTLTMLLYADLLLINQDRSEMLLLRATGKRYLCFKELSFLLCDARREHQLCMQHQMIVEEQLRFLDIHCLEASSVLTYYRRIAFLDGGAALDDVLIELERIGTYHGNPCQLALNLREALLMQMRKKNVKTMKEERN